MRLRFGELPDTRSLMENAFVSPAAGGGGGGGALQFRAAPAPGAVQQAGLPAVSEANIRDYVKKHGISVKPETKVSAAYAKRRLLTLPRLILMAPVTLLKMAKGFVTGFVRTLRRQPRKKKAEQIIAVRTYKNPEHLEKDFNRAIRLLNGMNRVLKRFNLPADIERTGEKTAYRIGHDGGTLTLLRRTPSQLVAVYS